MSIQYKIKLFNHFKYSVLILFVINLLVACGSLQISQNYSLNNSEGLVFFSMTQSGVLSSQYQLHFINDKTKVKYVVSFRKSDHHDIGFRKNDQSGFRRFDAAVGKLAVLRLPEGIYTLRKWSTKENKKKGKNSLKYSPNKKFRVMNAHSLYLGNLHLINSDTHSSLLIIDNRIRDLKLFNQRYPQVDKSKLLIASQSFLNPASGRDRVFDAYTSCTLEGYSLYSKKRLPTHVEKFRTLRVNSEDKKISRIDGYRLKFKGTDGLPELSMKVELSAAKDYVSDKSVTQEWFDEISKKKKKLEISYVKKGFFSEYQLKTNSLSKHGMIYMVTMFDDASQIITNMRFVNQPEYVRSYKTVDAFLPGAMAAVSGYQQCIVEQLNQRL